MSENIILIISLFLALIIIAKNAVPQINAVLLKRIIIISEKKELLEAELKNMENMLKNIKEEYKKTLFLAKNWKQEAEKVLKVKIEKLKEKHDLEIKLIRDEASASESLRIRQFNMEHLDDILHLIVKSIKNKEPKTNFNILKNTKH